MKANAADILTYDQKKTLVIEGDSVKDYADLISPLTSTFSIDDNFVRVGVPQKSQGWKIHISVISYEIHDLISKVVPILLQHKVPFKLLRNGKLHDKVNAGDYGEHLVGKIITIFLDDESKIAQLVPEIKIHINKLSGPQILSNFYIAPNIYAGYGTFIPHLVKDYYGNPVKLIKNGNGDDLEDQYTLPPTVPIGITNPFIDIADDAPGNPKQLIAGKYWLMKTLKMDLKGNVYKALYFSKFLKPSWCIIKEGKKGAFPDKHKRDIRNRLNWQNEISHILGKNLRIPKPLDLIEDDRISYFITEYVSNSKSLKDYTVETMKYIPWFAQPWEVKTNMLVIIKQLADSLCLYHENGVVNRDFTNNNYLVKKTGQLVSIDLELSYLITADKPNPPFTWGTPGFISPQQQRVESPSFQDDIYSFGAILLSVEAGGVMPVHIVEESLTPLKERIELLTHDQELRHLTLKCLDPIPENRPTAHSIRAAITSFQVDNKPYARPQYKRSEIDFEHLINCGIRTLGSDMMVHNGTWTTLVGKNKSWDAYPLRNKYVYSNLHQGVSGVIYTLCLLGDIGFDITSTQSNLDKSLAFVIDDLNTRKDNFSPSLYYGSTGIALMLSKLIASNRIPNNPQYGILFQQLFKQISEQTGLIYGIAGQGIAALKSSEILGFKEKKEIIEIYINTLLSEQKNGHWTKNKQEPKSEIHTGLGYGVAGIIYFLLKYYEEYKDIHLLQPIHEGLRFLTRKAKKKDNCLTWSISNKNKRFTEWWCVGGPGIALTFLQAYKIFGDSQYKDIAEKSLRINPEFFVYYNLGQCHGLAGIGEIYLEAFKITKNSEWHDRAEWISQLLYTLHRTNKDGHVYWIPEKYTESTASLMSGDSGILHFLTRFIKPGNLDFPIIG